MNLTLKMMTDTMAKFGINEINPIEEKFNPQWHEAMAMQPVPNAEDGTVLHVHQKGYQLNDRLLRPARVMVAKAVNAEKPLENQWSVISYQLEVLNLNGWRIVYTERTSKPWKWKGEPVIELFIKRVIYKTTGSIFKFQFSFSNNAAKKFYFVTFKLSNWFIRECLFGKLVLNQWITWNMTQ